MTQTRTRICIERPRGLADRAIQRVRSGTICMSFVKRIHLSVQSSRLSGKWWKLCQHIALDAVWPGKTAKIGEGFRMHALNYSSMHLPFLCACPFCFLVEARVVISSGTSFDPVL